MKKVGIISLVIGIGTFVLKMVDVFPEQAELLKIISFLFFGIVIGLIISRFAKDEIQFQEFSLRDFFPYFYYGFLGLAFFVIMILMIQIENAEKVSTLTSWLSAIGGFIVFSVLFSFHDIFPKLSTNNSTKNENDVLNIDDKITLAENYKFEKNYERSLHFYESIKKNLSIADDRRSQIDSKISEVKSLQINKDVNRKIDTK